MSPNTVGEIITFYSYKGGTGRSMALSNVACILADGLSKSKGKNVLMIDWDLEAPGLHRYFHDKFNPEFLKQPGLIDLFIELESFIPKTGFGIEEAEKKANDILKSIDLKKYVTETDIPHLSLLMAGSFDHDYPGRVNTFNWEDLYNRSPYLFILFAEKLVREYRYVLIDSRTGYTDISGICTSLMSEKLVVVFTPNRQNYTGITEIIKAATNYRRKSDDLRPLLVYPLPTRIESSRDDLRAYWRFGNSNKDIVGYQPMFEDLFKEVYGISDCDLNDYFDKVQIQHSPDYAYGENIAVLVEKTEDRFSLSESYRAFTKWLLESSAPWRKPSNKDDLAASLGNQALILQSRGDLDGTMKLHKEQEKIYREMDNIDGLAASLGNQALILKAWGQLEEAMQLLKQQEKICRELNNKDSLQRSLGNQANILQAWGQLEEAMKLHKEQEMICRELGSKESLAISLGNQANILKAWGQLEEAMQLLKQQEKICRELNNKEGLQASLGNQALILQTRGDLDSAMKLLKEQERICRELGNIDSLQRSLGNQALILQSKSGTKMKVLEGHTDVVESCCVSPDGTRIISGSDGETLGIWDANKKVMKPWWKFW